MLSTSRFASGPVGRFSTSFEPRFSSPQERNREGDDVEQSLWLADTRKIIYSGSLSLSAQVS